MSTTTISTTPIMIQCRECYGYGTIAIDHPMDPYGRSRECDSCDGEGEVEAGCQCCPAHATEVFDDLMLCHDCAEEQRHETIRAWEMPDAN